MAHSNPKSNLLPVTNEDTLGPYYPIPFCDQDSLDLTCYHPGLIYKPQGEKIIIKGRLLDRHGKLANGALLEFWQANANGIYRTPDNEISDLIDPYFSGYARHRTPDGSFELITIKPGINKQDKCPRAPNITLTIFSDGIMRLVTQFFFDDEGANDQDPVLLSLPDHLRGRLMAKFDGKDNDGCKIYKIDVIMAGDNETPFFDDLLS